MATLLDRGSTPLISTILNIYASSIECLINGSMLLAFFCTQKNIKVNNFYRFDCAQ